MSKKTIIFKEPVSWALNGSLTKITKLETVVHHWKPDTESEKDDVPSLESTVCIIFPSFDNRDWATFEKPAKPIEFGTPIMTSNNGTHWKLKKYSDNITQKYIVPVDKFDFTNFENNKY